MNIERQIEHDVMSGVAITDAPEDLAVIHYPTTSAAIWRRAPTEAFQTWIDALAPKDLPSIRTTFQAGASTDVMTNVLGANDMVPEGEAGVLANDMAALASLFAEIMAAPFLRLRLDVITGDACRKFHTDAVKARLICTYRGKGTQYGLRSGKNEPSQIFITPTGSPILLKGSAWPDGRNTAFVHRSPPMLDGDAVRLVMVLDPIYDADHAQ